MATCTPVLEHGVQRLGAPVCSCRSPSGHSTGRSGWGSSCTRKRASCSQAARSLVGPAMAGVLHNQGEEVVALCCGARRGTCRSRLWQAKVACWQHGACQPSRGSNPVMMQASSPDRVCCDPAAVSTLSAGLQSSCCSFSHWRSGMLPGQHLNVAAEGPGPEYLSGLPQPVLSSADL